MKRPRGSSRSRPRRRATLAGAVIVALAPAVAVLVPVVAVLVPVVAVLVPVVAVLAPVTGCGVKDAPRPMEDTATRAPDDFTARDAAGGVLLRWQRPQEAVDGEPLYDLAGFDVERRRPEDRRFEVIHRILTTDTDRLRPQQTFRYTDEAAPPGPLEYRVRAFLQDGQRGIPSRIATIHRAAPAGARHTTVPPTGAHDTTAPPAGADDGPSAPDGTD